VGAEFDWRERPMMSPLGGFLIQSRAGESGNFEVVIPWPGGGLAHFARDNDADRFKWLGPMLFGRGEYTGATVIESDFREFRDNRLGNLEVAAVRPDGVVDSYWRENGGAFLWKGPFTLPFGSAKSGNPAMAYTGAWQDDPPFVVAHGPSSFFLAVPNAAGGFAFWRRRNLDNGEIFWENTGGTGSTTLVGVGLALTTWSAPTQSTGYKDIGAAIGNNVVAGVTGRGQLELHVHGDGDSAGISRAWIDRTVFGRDAFGELDGQFVGRPCLIQGDFGYEEDGAFSTGHYGNLELIVPARSGGFLHFWRDCGEPLDAFTPIASRWSGPARIAGPLYDEVSFIQSNFSTTDNGNLELVARRRHQQGFDFYFRDEQGAWHGPQRVGPPPPQELRWRHTTPSFGQVKVAADTSPTSWYTPTEKIQHIAYVGEDKQIHECFFRIGGENRWEHSVPSAGQTPARRATSPTSWYTAVDNVQHIAYVGEDDMIHECFFRIGGENRWEHNVPNAGQVRVFPGATPTSWYTTPENIQHIAYVGNDRLLHECFFRIGPGDRWEHNVPSADALVPQAVEGSGPTSWYTTPENVQHIAYVDTGFSIRECFYFIGGENRWLHGFPNQGAESVRPNTSPTSWYATPDNVQHVAYVDRDGLVHQCFFFIGGFGGWQHEVTNAGEVPVARDTSPTSWYTTSENVQHIAYVGTDGQIHECFLLVRVGVPHVWRHNVPSAGHEAAALDASPTSWYTPADNVQHVAYVGVGREIQECFFFIP
jgi:hypothetical protein